MKRNSLAAASITLLLCFCLSINTAAGLNKNWVSYQHLVTQPQLVSNWLIVKCAFSDEPSVRQLPPLVGPQIADLDTYISDFLTTAGQGTGNATDYFSDISYGAISFDVSRTVGWYTVPFAKAAYPGRTQAWQQCIQAIPQSDASQINFGALHGIIAFWNDWKDAGACSTAGAPQPVTILGQTFNLSCVVLDPAGLWTAFAAHELGHGLGLPHSFDSKGSSCNGAPGEYCDPFDIMSALNTQQFSNPNYPPNLNGVLGNQGGPGAGPGMNVPNLLQLGVLPPTRIATYEVGQYQYKAYTISALSHPETGQPLTVELIGDDSNDIFTLEYRQTDGWDQQLASNCVIIHEYKKTSQNISFLQDGANDGRWLAGTSWRNDTLGVVVTVQNISPQNYTATVLISPTMPTIHLSIATRKVTPLADSPVTATADLNDANGKSFQQVQLKFPAEQSIEGILQYSGLVPPQMASIKLGLHTAFAIFEGAEVNVRDTLGNVLCSQQLQSSVVLLGGNTSVPFATPNCLQSALPAIIVQEIGEEPNITAAINIVLQ